MSKGYMYILECSDGSYYTGSTIDLELRINQHQSGEGANHTRKRLPVKLVYYEIYDRIDEAFYREKQVQGWSRKKKEALIENKPQDLPMLSKNYTEYVASTGSATAMSSATEMSNNVASTGSATEMGNNVASTSSATDLEKFTVAEEKIMVAEEKFTVAEPVEATVNFDQKILENLKTLKF